jgi:hypothetical protein
VPAVRTSAVASIMRIESLPGAGKKIPTNRPMPNISLGANALGRTPRRADYLCRRGTVRARHRNCTTVNLCLFVRKITGESGSALFFAGNFP